MIQPSPIASVMRAASAGIGQQQPAPRRDAVRLVVEALRKQLGKILDRRRAQQLRVDGRDAVGAVRADDGEIGHADLALAAFLDEAHARDAAVVAGEPVADLAEEAAVDLEDDLQIAAAAPARTSGAAISRAPRAAACGSCRRACGA